MPSSAKARRAILAAIPNTIQGSIFELGSGWGTLAFPLARKFPRCTVYAYEISPLPWLFSKLLKGCYSLDNLHICRQNFFKISFKEASVIVCYLYPGAMQNLKPKFEAELIPGTWVISHTFAIPGWIPHQTYQLNDLYRNRIYVYRK